MLSRCQRVCRSLVAELRLEHRLFGAACGQPSAVPPEIAIRRVGILTDHPFSVLAFLAAVVLQDLLLSLRELFSVFFHLRRDELQSITALPYLGCSGLADEDL